MAKVRHTWKFFRAGGVDQVVLATASDLENLHTLDQKLWVALACPTVGLELDARTLALLDTDGNGRIRPPEILAAIAWTREVLRDLGELFTPSDELPLDSIDARTATGKDVLAGAKLILKNLGKGEATSISLADVSDTEKIFVATKLNGDGIVPADSADDEETSRVIADVLAVMGSVPDRSGKPGVDQARVDAFFDQAARYADWLDAGRGQPSPRAFGPATDAAVTALDPVRAKVNDYFARCRLAAFDARAAAALNAAETDLVALGPQLLTTTAEDVARLPLARVEAGRPLPLGDGVNPAWASRMAAFAQTTVATVFGAARTSLTEADWGTLLGKLGPYETWLAAKPATEVAKLGDERVTALARGDARARVVTLIARDAALATESNQIGAVEKLIRFRRHLLTLLKNFVNFAEFYGRRGGIFQAGTLYVDARSCDLCLPVDDAGRHALLASLSQACLAYCDCVRRKDKEKRSIVAAVTGGDTDNLMAGRNGVFYDRKGDDWDATITKFVDNPISVRQAFWTPYKRFIRLVEEQLAKRAKTADDEGAKKLNAAALEAPAADDKKPDDKKADEKPKDAAEAPAAAAAPEKGIDIGTVAAIGVAVGGIATFFSSILATFLGLGMWMPLGFLALLLAISGPSMLIAWLKLRQRNIGPLLDANGWAVNALAYINVPFGGALTGVAKLPDGASRSLVDPFAQKKRPWRFYGFLVLLGVLGVAWLLGKLDAYMPDKVKASTVLHRTPAAVVAPAPAAPSAGTR
ncbi:MAG TPA: hypothetical protein VGL81_33805 [Polyangiaceae bacterium]|jgi:hypothetical protein